MGLFLPASASAQALRLPLVTYIVLHYGWRASFWASALIGVAAGLIWYWLARDRPEEHPWITPEETALIEQGLPEPAAELEIGEAAALAGDLRQ